MNVQNFDKMSMIRLEVSIWSGRAKLRRDDLPDNIVADLPPETLASMGSKKLFDPTKLKIFNTLKARASTTLDKKCTRFLGGWATHEDRLPELQQKLDAIKTEFYHEQQQFMQHWHDNLDAWLAQYPSWASILRAAVPTYHEVSGKFSFNWQMYKVAPASADPALNANLNDALGGIEDGFLDEVAKDISDVYNECFKEKEVVTKKAFRPVRTLLDKVRGLTFVHPRVTGLEKVLENALGLVENAANSPQHIAMFKSFLLALSSPVAIKKTCDDFVTNQVTLAQVFDPFWATATPQPPAPVVPPHNTQGLDALQHEAEQVLGTTPPIVPVPGLDILSSEDKPVAASGILPLNGLW